MAIVALDLFDARNKWYHLWNEMLYWKWFYLSRNYCFCFTYFWCAYRMIKFFMLSWFYHITSTRSMHSLLNKQNPGSKKLILDYNVENEQLFYLEDTVFRIIKQRLEMNEKLHIYLHKLTLILKKKFYWTQQRRAPHYVIWSYSSALVSCNMFSLTKMFSIHRE